MQLYSGTCSGLTLVRDAQLDALLGFGFRATGVTIGNTYYVKVRKSNNGSPTKYHVCWSNLTAIVSPCTCPSQMNTPGNTCQLVCNYDFDYFTGNLGNGGLIHLACPWDNPSGGYVATPDYYNSLGTTGLGVPVNGAGTQADYAGINDGYAGIACYVSPGYSGYVQDTREYIRIKLNQPMANGQKYRISFYANLADGSGFAISDLGALISTTALNQFNWTFISATPQVFSSTPITNKTTWTQISGTWTVPATGTYEWLTIGQFKSDANSTITTTSPSSASNISWVVPYQAYYLIDHVTIEPDVSLSATASPNNICPLVTSTLSATNSVTGNPTSITYTWTPSTFLNSTTGNPVYSTPTYGLYYYPTATLSNYNNCTIQFDTVGLNVLTGPYNLYAGADQTICEGSSATLTGSSPGGGTTWGWQVLGGNVICTSCTSTVVSPTTTTSYIFFSVNTNTGCADQDTMTVNVNPAPGNLVSPANASTCSGSLNFSITGGPYSSYSWSSNGTPSSGTGSTFSSNWNSSAGNGILTVTVVTTMGCTRVMTDTIPGCCVSGTNPNLLNTQTSNLSTQFPTLGSYVGGYYEIAGKTFTVNGTLTIDQNTRWRGCTVRMGMDAKIIVGAGIKFRITASAASFTKIGACDYLWDGIYVDGTNAASEVIVDSASVIEDAKNTFYSSACGKYTVTGAGTNNRVKLNKNKVAVVATGCTGTHPGTIQNTVISCDYASSHAGYTAGWTSSGSNCRPPYSNVSYAAVIVQNCTDVTVGDSSSSSLRNLFERLRYGVYEDRSTVKVWNNDFKYIRTLPAPPGSTLPDGIAVYSKGYWLLTRTMTVGRPGTANAGNKFIGCNYPVWAENYMHVYAQNNTIDTTYSTGITLVGCKARTQLIDKNTFLEFPTGIRVLDAYGSTLTISNNSMNQASNSLTTFGNTGIVVLNAVLANGNVKIFNNDMRKMRTGIWVSQVRKPKVYDNPLIRFLPTQPATPVAPAIGIKLENCKGALVKNNNIDRNVTSVSTNDHDKFFGIHVTNCINDSVYKNTLTKMGSGIFFKGSDNPSLIACNSMTSCAYGVNFNFTAGNFQAPVSIDSQIVWQNQTPTPTGNTWSGCNKDIIGIINSSNAVAWFRNNSYNPVINMFSGSFSGNVTTNLNSASDQCSSLFIAPGPVDNRDYILAGIAKNPRTYDTLNDEFLYIDREAAFRMLRDSSHWLSLGHADDSYYQSFYDDQDKTNIGLFAEAEDSIAAGNLWAARLIVDAISPVGKPEENRKAVMQVYLDTWAQDNYYLNDVQKAILDPIENEFAVSGGNAVFDARNMLYHEIHDSGMVRLHHPIGETVAPAPSKIYPNPSTGEITLELQIDEQSDGKVEVFDLSGRIVQRLALQQGSKHLLNNGALQNGIYLLRIIVNGSVVLTERFVILKQE